MAYIGVSPFNGVRKKHTYTATASQTSFSGVGAEGITLSYKDSTFVDVFQNGVKLGEADYTSTSGTAIVLAQGASLNDIVEVVVYDVFSVADTVSKADGGTFDGNVTMGGTLGVTGVHTIGTNAVATSEGGATTTNIVQGLAKTFAVVTNSGGTSTLQDSFNLTSITDGAAGITTFTFANDFSSANYAFSFGLESHAGATLIAAFGESASAAAGSIIGRSAIADGTATDGAHITLSAHGDLA